jgi:dephospho-CoA kinase
MLGCFDGTQDTCHKRARASSPGGMAEAAHNRNSFRHAMAAAVKVIGLTGGIGTGKTTVSGVLADLGAFVIHADQVGHDVYQPGTAGWRRVTAAFGTDVVAADGTIDRKRLGAMVFNSAPALARLNAIVHPLIAAEIRRRIEAHRASQPSQPIVIEAALLIEANWIHLVDEVWLITATRQSAIERVRAERGLAPAEVAARIDAQLDDVARRQVADIVIENTGSLVELQKRVREVWTAHGWPVPQ